MNALCAILLFAFTKDDLLSSCVTYRSYLPLSLLNNYVGATNNSFFVVVAYVHFANLSSLH